MTCDNKLWENFEIKDYINKLIKKYKGIKEIWWFGSRAINCNVTCDSDWDFIAFAHQSTFPNLEKDDEMKEEAKRLKIDLFVEIKKGVYKSPWGTAKLYKRELQWIPIPQKDLAIYCASMTRATTPEERYYLNPEQKKLIEGGANNRLDISDWRIAKKIYP
jgi:predicted nucleotidyltransferase